LDAAALMPREQASDAERNKDNVLRKKRFISCLHQFQGVVNITFFRIAQKKSKVNAKPETNLAFSPVKIPFFETKRL